MPIIWNIKKIDQWETKRLPVIKPWILFSDIIKTEANSADSNNDNKVTAWKADYSWINAQLNWIKCSLGRFCFQTSHWSITGLLQRIPLKGNNNQPTNVGNRPTIGLHNEMKVCISLRATRRTYIQVIKFRIEQDRKTLKITGTQKVS